MALQEENTGICDTRHHLIGHGPSILYQEQAPPTAKNAAQSIATDHDENSPSGNNPTTKKQWKRSDTLAGAAIVISIFSFVVTLAATYVAYRADKRTQLSDTKGATAVVADLGDKAQLLEQDSDFSGTFVQAFLDAEKQHPESKDHIKWLEFDLLRRGKLPDLKLSTDKLTLLSHGNGDAASVSAACASRRDEIEADMESLAAVKPSDWDQEQLNALHVLPYRLHKLSDLCSQAEKSLATLTLAINSNEPLRGTVGELEAAQADEARRTGAGFPAKLEISRAPDKRKVLDSQEATKSKN
jgi:hypothetical protein